MLKIDDKDFREQFIKHNPNIKKTSITEQQLHFQTLSTFLKLRMTNKRLRNKNNESM